LETIFETEQDKQYLSYIDEHINNVKLVWKELQQFLKNEFWLDDHSYFCIQKLIEEHDKSKYNEDEFYGYRQYFYPEENKTKSRCCFSQSWNIHQKTNKHHWQYWVMIEDSGKQIILEMPFFFIVELLCDWTAMSVKFNNKPSEWYQKNKDKMLFADSTIACIERWLPLFDEVFVILSK